MSKPAFANIIPVTPPIVNNKMNPNINKMGVLYANLPPYKVANHEKIFIPVGTAIIIVAEVKYALESTSKPTTNIWCAQTKNPKIPMETKAHTIPKYPKMGVSMIVSKA